MLSSGSDGTQDMPVKQYTAGINNQGAGATVTNGDPGMLTVQPNWPNGILGTFSGNRTKD